MSAPCPVFQEVFQRMRTTATPQQLPYAACCRLALLVTGILAAKSTVLAQIAAELEALHLTHATQTESIARRLRRTLNDPHLTVEACYDPLLKQVIDWPQVLRDSRQVVVILDESTKTDQVHLLRASLPTGAGVCPWRGRSGNRTFPCPRASIGTVLSWCWRAWRPTCPRAWTSSWSRTSSLRSPASWTG